MNRSITTKRLVSVSILLLLLAVTPAVYGQAEQAASAEQIQALQKKLDALQSQMAEVQGELQQLSGGAAPPTHVPAGSFPLLSLPSNKTKSLRPRRN